MRIDTIDIGTSALLLDVDGTLLDISPRPQDVTVPSQLTAALEYLNAQSGGTVAFVSGRTLDDLDRLFAPLQLAAVAGHGAEMRLSSGAGTVRRNGPLAEGLRQRLATIASGLDGIIIEDKGYSLALHYRLAPQHADAVRHAVEAACASDASHQLEMLPGKAMIEIKPAAFNKGTGVCELMQHSPFRGRRPVFIGDDVTDQAAFRALPEFDGLGFSVGHRLPGLAGCFPSPHDVREWLYRVAAVNGAVPS